MVPSARERRKSQRVHLRRRVWCEGEDITLYVPALNASEGGLFLRTATPLARGKLARIDLELETGESVSAEVEVVWARSPARNESLIPGMGVRILRILRGAEEFARLLEQSAADEDDTLS